MAGCSVAFSLVLDEFKADNASHRQHRQLASFLLLFVWHFLFSFFIFTLFFSFIYLFRVHTPTNLNHQN